MNCLSQERKIYALELEWIRYKYTVMEKSPQDYVAIRQLLSNKFEYPAIDFYDIIANANE
jgi:UV DNA damage endonuclease